MHKKEKTCSLQLFNLSKAITRDANTEGKRLMERRVDEQKGGSREGTGGYTELQWSVDFLFSNGNLILASKWPQLVFEVSISLKNNEQKVGWSCYFLLLNAFFCKAGLAVTVHWVSWRCSVFATKDIRGFLFIIQPWTIWKVTEFSPLQFLCIHCFFQLWVRHQL